jgi:hypothetical protein
MIFRGGGLRKCACSCSVRSSYFNRKHIPAVAGHPINQNDSAALRVPILSGIAKPKTVRSDEKLTAFRELESAIRGESHFTNGTTLDLTFANPDRERSYFDADLFKQLRESWVRTQVQTSKVAVFPDPRYASVFVLQALLKTSKGFVMIA